MNKLQVNLEFEGWLERERRAGEIFGQDFETALYIAYLAGRVSYKREIAEKKGIPDA